MALYNENEKMWRVQKNKTPPLNKNGDSMSIDIIRLENQKIVAVRCSDDVSDDKIQKALEIIEECSESRSVVFVIGQLNDYPHKLTFLIVTPNKIEKIQKLLLEQDFNQETLSISTEFDVCERERFKIHFRGNIILVGESEIKLTYNSHLSNRVEFLVQEKDKYAQKNKESYQGYISVSKGEKLSEENILYETVINIPKYENETNRSTELDFEFKPTDVINNEYLRFLSREIGDDWKNLGLGLQLSEQTIRRIANGRRTDVGTMAYHCLLKWIKNTTVQSKRVHLMEKALRSIGRIDLVKDLLFRSMSQ